MQRAIEETKDGLKKGNYHVAEGEAGVVDEPERGIQVEFQMTVFGCPMYSKKLKIDHF